jgi:hypothetical protein
MSARPAGPPTATPRRAVAVGIDADGSAVRTITGKLTQFDLDRAIAGVRSG